LDAFEVNDLVYLGGRILMLQQWGQYWGGTCTPTQGMWITMTMLIMRHLGLGADEDGW
jgi:hypothetical protein